jgi:fluoroquinolone transport system permease protein
MVPWDVRLQYRYGFYAVYAVLTVLFVGALRSIPAGSARDTALQLLVFSDPSFLGFYFVAALVLFEKGQGVVGALVTSPLSTRAYLWSKALSLTLLALVATTAVTALGYGTDVRWVPLLAGVALTSVLFVFVGFVAVARFDSVNAYFMTALAYMTVLGGPVLGLVGLVETPLFYLLPAQPSLVLFEAALGPVPALELAYAVGYLVVAIGVAAVAARRSTGTSSPPSTSRGATARPSGVASVGSTGPSSRSPSQTSKTGSATRCSSTSASPPSCWASSGDTSSPTPPTRSPDDWTWRPTTPRWSRDSRCSDPRSSASRWGF